MIRISKLAAGLRRRETEALQFAATAVEYRGKFKQGELRLISHGSLPRILHEVYGGSFSIKIQGTVRGVFWIRGKRATELLELLCPYFVERGREAVEAITAAHQIDRGKRHKRTKNAPKRARMRRNST